MNEILCTMAPMTQDETWLLTEKYDGILTEAFEQDRLRLAQGEPLGYIIGWVPFLDTHITLNSHPLIPRPETEYWTEMVIKDMRVRSTPIHALDLCAGSGCIGIALLKAIENTQVDFAELVDSHHETIRANIVLNEIDPDRTRIIGGDLFEHVTDRYDLILTNPPYIDPVLDRTTESVKGFEPHTALYGGTHGLELIERIVKEAPKFLKPYGVLILEHEPEQTEHIARLAHEAGFVAETHTDQFHVQRFTRMVLY